MRLFHLLGEADWSAAQAAGTYAPKSLETEGFVHLSTQAQVRKTAARFFAGRSDVLVLIVDRARLRAEVRFDPADGELFPHLYGALNLDAVTDVVPFSLLDVE